MANFAVIDTETNWHDQVMSIGTVIADGCFRPLEMKYHILPAFCRAGGMYTDALLLQTPVQPTFCTRREAMEELLSWLRAHQVRNIYAYNANFDRTHLPELGRLRWHDIMRLAAYRQYNPAIGPGAEVCSTGRLKRGYGVEPMLQLLSGDRCYRETHNAMLDALDELRIMALLGHRPENYLPL